MHPAPTVLQAFPADLPAVRARQRHQRRSARTFWVIMAVAFLCAAAVAAVAVRERSERGGDLASPATTVAPTVAPPVAGTVPAPAATAPTPPTAAQAQLLMIGAPVPPARPVTPDSAEQTFRFILRRYDTADSGSPAIDHDYVYDVSNDVGRVITTSSSQPRITFTQFDRVYRTVSYPDGRLERIPRSAASLSPEPDIWLARRLGQEDLIPEVARQFTNVVSVDQQDDDGRPLTVIGAHLDVAAFAAQFPSEHADWLWRWASQTPFDPVLIDPTGRQLATDPFERDDDPAPPQPLEGLEFEMEIDQAGIIYALDDSGTVTIAVIIDPVAGFRAWYYFADASDAPLDVREVDSHTWADAPA